MRAAVRDARKAANAAAPGDPDSTPIRCRRVVAAACGIVLPSTAEAALRPGRTPQCRCRRPACRRRGFHAWPGRRYS